MSTVGAGVVALISGVFIVLGLMDFVTPGVREHSEERKRQSLVRPLESDPDFPIYERRVARAGRRAVVGCYALAVGLGVPGVLWWSGLLGGYSPWPWGA